MNRHPDFEELQDFREEMLSPERHEEIRAHLQECESCREDLAALTGLLEDLAELPVEAEPSRDLWPQIQWRISAGATPQRSRPRSSRVTLPLWQLLAAGIVLALVSGGSVWAFLAGSGRGPGSLAQEGAPMTTPAIFASEYAAYGEYSDAVAELEVVVVEGWEYLGPETIRVLEENLAIIDEAILESTEALADDPGSRILRRLLSETMRRKVDLLQRAAEVIIANT